MSYTRASTAAPASSAQAPSPRAFPRGPHTPGGRRATRRLRARDLWRITVACQRQKTAHDTPRRPLEPGRRTNGRPGAWHAWLHRLSRPARRVGMAPRERKNDQTRRPGAGQSGKPKASGNPQRLGGKPKPGGKPPGPRPPQLASLKVSWVLSKIALRPPSTSGYAKWSCGR